MLFLFNGNIKINNDIKKKIKFDISFYLEETNHKRIFYKFLLGWFNGKKSPAKFVNYEVLNRKNKIPQKFLSKLIFVIDKVTFDLLIQFVIFKR